MRGLHELVKSPAQHSTDENADAEISWNKNTSFLIVVKSRPHAQAIGTGEDGSARCAASLRTLIPAVEKTATPTQGRWRPLRRGWCFLRTASGPLVATRLGGKHLNITASCRMAGPGSTRARGIVLASTQRVTADQAETMPSKLSSARPCQPSASPRLLVHAERFRSSSGTVGTSI